MERNYTVKVFPSTGPAYTLAIPLQDTGMTQDHIFRFIDTFLEEHTKQVEHWELQEGPMQEHAPLLLLDDYISVMRFWAYGPYKTHPLCFVDIGKPSPSQVVRILSQYDEWYGNTDQDTEDYALEYQILARMLLCDNKLLLNPKFLDTTEPDMVSWLDDMLREIRTPTTKDGLTAFALARRLRQDEITALYRSCDGESEQVTAATPFIYCGYHFQPLLQIDERKVDANKLMRQVSSDTALGMSTYDWRRFPYSYNGFYAAACTVGARHMDLFRCVENGLVYIPGENELFLYHGTLPEVNAPC